MSKGNFGESSNNGGQIIINLPMKVVRIQVNNFKVYMPWKRFLHKQILNRDVYMYFQKVEDLAIDINY